MKANLPYGLTDYDLGILERGILSERQPGEGNGTPLQYSCLGNARDREAWWATVHGVTRVGHNLVTKPPPPPLLPNRGPVPGACSYFVIYIYIYVKDGIWEISKCEKY